MIQGKIIKGIGGFYYVKTQDAIYECKARGKFKNNNIKLIVGDNVLIDIIDKKKYIASIDELIERKNELIRPKIANVDQIIVVASISKPKVDFLVLDKLIIFNKLNNIPTILVFNKLDEATNDDIARIKEIYINTGIDIIFTSAENGIGIDELREILIGKLSVFSGNSGVGKSTLTNKLLNISKMETGHISKKIGRGKHTTRHTEIFKLDESSFIADTPGYGNFNICELELDELKNYYNEFIQYDKYCKFNMCSHTHEPNCKIKEMVEIGKVSRMRYNNYIKIYNELKGRR